jgi:hypothetical protein
MCGQGFRVAEQEQVFNSVGWLSPSSLQIPCDSTVGRPRPDVIVGESLKFGRLLDPGWQDYNYPAPLQDTTNYRAFFAWETQNNGAITGPVVR